MKNYENKAKRLLKSRKFWAALAASAGVAAGYFTGQVDAWKSIEAFIAIMASYSLGTGIEDSGRSSGGNSTQPTP